MDNLFQSAGLEQAAPRPLADRLRPQSLSDVVGQDHLIAPSAPIGRMLAKKRLGSMILWGPPGVGKTTIARLLAGHVGLEFVQLSAVFSGVSDLRKVFDAAKARRETGQGTILFVDEIHRFNKAQQDSFLPFVEQGVVTLIGATTENPSFELNNALLSRMQVFVLKALEPSALDALLQRAEAQYNQDLPLTPDGRKAVIDFARGDGRYVLSLADEIFSLNLGALNPGAVNLGAPNSDNKAEQKTDSQGLKGGKMNAKAIAQFLQKRAPAYDKSGEQHYNLISALHKSMRGSDPDAALYWLARMLSGGEDPLYILRRLVRFASEDIGLADPMALLICAEAQRSYRVLGSPEGELLIAQAVVHLACAPKSNAVYAAFKAAMVAARNSTALAPPAHILNAPTTLMRSIGYGKDYAYDHNLPESFSGQNYFPDAMVRQDFYTPKGHGEEAAIKERLEHWQRLRQTLNADRSAETK